MRKALIKIIKAYQKVLSPIFGRLCKHYPTCSNYAIDAINKYGAAKGTMIAAWRIIRCNPFSEGGYDPVK